MCLILTQTRLFQHSKALLCILISVANFLRERRRHRHSFRPRPLFAHAPCRLLLTTIVAGGRVERLSWLLPSRTLLTTAFSIVTLIITSSDVEKQQNATGHNGRQKPDFEDAALQRHEHCEGGRKLLGICTLLVCIKVCLKWTPRTRLQLSRVPRNRRQQARESSQIVLAQSRVCMRLCRRQKKSTHQESLMIFGCIASRRSSSHPKNSLKILVTSFLVASIHRSICGWCNVCVHSKPSDLESLVRNEP